jgi:hypothetical protein
MQFIDTFKIPTFAICAIVNGDFSGVNDEDQKEIETFLNQFKNGFIADWCKNIDSPHFCTIPSIGQMACECVDVDFYLP